ncbi:MAG: hypothetical protein O7B81_07670 [Gammaproteobacteria bacterium]|nr:hypothetical protein [Gammaproteobacteria bacterium]
MRGLAPADEGHVALQVHLDYPADMDETDPEAGEFLHVESWRGAVVARTRV